MSAGECNNYQVDQGQGTNDGSILFHDDVTRSRGAGQIAESSRHCGAASLPSYPSTAFLPVLHVCSVFQVAVNKSVSTGRP